MKQHISIEQLNELTNEQKEKFLNSLNIFNLPDGLILVDKVKFLTEFQFRLPSIGQMIEFLGDDFKTIYVMNFGIRGDHWNVKTEKMYYAGENGIELCDALWEACKDKLKNETL